MTIVSAKLTRTHYGPSPPPPTLLFSALRLPYLALLRHDLADLDSLLLDRKSLGLLLAAFVTFHSSGEVDVATFRVEAGPIALCRSSSLFRSHDECEAMPLV